jgi:serine/threonine-protein kinase
MQREPSPNLVALLERLRLATRKQILSVAPAARRLGGELPDFEPVWVDALAQARILTPLQAAEINAGRGDALVYGPFQITGKLTGPGYAECYAACHHETKKPARLYVVRRPQRPVAELHRPLAAWLETSRLLIGTLDGMVEAAGTSGSGFWAACPAIDGVVAADWLAENGRLPSTVVWEIARQLVAQLATLEHHNLVHGDISASSLLLLKAGRALLPMPGMRGLVRPAEGYSFCDLQPEALDSVSPERVACGGPPTTEGDMYACGALWWRLLTGRPAMAGGSSLLKLKAIHASQVLDVRQLAPDVPAALAQAIAATTMTAPSHRPQSFAALREMLGDPTRSGTAQLARCVTRPTQVWHTPPRRRRPAHSSVQPGGRTLRFAVTAAVLAVIGGVGVYAQHRSAATGPIRPAETAAGTGSTPLSRHPTAVASAAAKPVEAVEEFLPRSASQVRLATATTPSAAGNPEPLILPSGKTVLRRGLALRAGQCVRGKAGQRPTISVPRGGLSITSEDVRFEGIDFVWEHEQDPTTPGRPWALFNVEAQTIEFRGCSFSASADGPAAAVALLGASSPLAVGGCELTLSDCVFRETSAVVDCLAAPHLAILMRNSLCLSSGPVLRLHRAPHADEAINFTLEHVTARGASPVLECRLNNDLTAGPISISATACVFDTPAPASLLVFGGARPVQILASLAWTGHGSLVTPETSMARWSARGRASRPLDEDAIDIAGLARCQAEFAGPLEGPPAASRITRWQGPLRSSDPPGARVHTLHLASPLGTRTDSARQ